MQEDNEQVGRDEEEFKPYVAAERAVPEFTIRSIVLGVVLGIVFGAANAYLGLSSRWQYCAA